MLPAPTQRLFPAAEVDELSDDNRSLVISRLLEEGDTDDLRWLFLTLGERRVATWLAERGGRLLSRRSRRFWHLVLGREPGPTAALTEELWLL